MDPQDTLARLDQLIQSCSILCHPFYVAWQRGKLTTDQLATYAQVNYPHVAAFPRYLVAAIGSASDPVIRAELERNPTTKGWSPKPTTNYGWISSKAWAWIEQAWPAQT